MFFWVIGAFSIKHFILLPKLQVQQLMSQPLTLVISQSISTDHDDISFLFNHSIGAIGMKSAIFQLQIYYMDFH